MNLLHLNWAPLDEAYAFYSRAHQGEAESWLLDQTVATASDRRRLLETVPIKREMSVLDVGTGFGPMALELAHLTSAQVVGIDVDDGALGTARAVAGRVQPWLHVGSVVRFEHCDLASLPGSLDRIAPEVASAANPGFDLAVCRLVLQHVPDPAAAIASIAATVRHGGYLWIFDVDDGLTASWPPTSAAYNELEFAFRSWQASYGGDREIGRKLPALLAGADLLVHGVHVNSSSAWSVSRPGDATREGAAHRIRAAMGAMIDGGFVSEARAEALLETFAHEPPTPRLRVETQLVAVAQRP